MKKSAEIRQELNGLVSSQTAIATAMQTEKRTVMTDAEKQTFDDLQTQITEKRAELARQEQYEENLRSVGPSGNGSSVTAEERELNKMKEVYSIHKVVRSLNGQGRFDGVEKEIDEETRKRAANVAGIAFSGIAVPTDFGKRSIEKRSDAQTVTADSGAYGANLVATELQSPIEFLRPKPVLETLGARMITGLTGNLKFPTNDGGIIATWEGEEDAIDYTKNAYGSKDMTPKRLGASVLISLQNLMQSVFDVEMMTVEDINLALAQAIDAAGINGAGSGNVPMGILNATGVGSVVGGTNGAAPTWEHLVALETAIYSANADAAKMGYLINPQTRGKLKTTPKESGQPIYLMSDGGQINGYPSAISTLVPNNLTKGTASAVCSAGIFGDFNQLLIGQWAFMDLSVDNVSKKRAGYVELTANTFIDILIRQPKAFARVKDWLSA